MSSFPINFDSALETSRRENYLGRGLADNSLRFNHRALYDYPTKTAGDKAERNLN